MVGRSKLYGRDTDLERLLDLTATSRLVTVTGTGGIGKTRLVEEAIPRLRERAGDHVYVAHLADVDVSADIAVLSAQLGFTSPEALAVSVGDEEGIVVLDSCEHVIGSAAEVASRLLAASDGLRVLTTSREPVGLPGEELLVLEPLALPKVDDLDPLAAPAATMFLDRAVASGARWERTDEVVAAIGELCRRVDGLPLALELAASRARTMSPAEVLALLDERLDVLRTRESGRPERHRSVRAAIDVSTALLTDEALEFFHRLGAFSGCFDLDLAHAVAGPELDDRLVTVDLLTELVDRSLVVPEPTGGKTRYRLLDLLREYAHDALRAAGRWDDTNERMTRVMATEADRIIAEGTSGWTAELVTRITGNVGNLTSAVDWCIAHDPAPDRAVRLFVPLFAAVHQSRSAEVRALGERLVQRWPTDLAPLRAEALAVLATAYSIASQPERSVELARSALDDPNVTAIGEVVALRALTLTAIGEGDIEAAYEHATTARRSAREAGLGSFERELAGFEASLLDRTGRHEEAAAVATEAAAASLAAGDRITEIWAHLVVATVAMRAGRFEAARAAVDAAQATSRSIQDVWWGGAIFRSQALLASHEAAASTVLDGWSTSKELWRRAIGQAARRGDLPELALTLKLAAVVAARAGHTDTAHALLDAVPPSPELTVLPELFEEERVRLEASRPPADAGPRPTLVIALRHALAAIDEGAGEPEGAASPASAPPVRPSLRLEGAVWAITWGGSTVRVRDAKGLRDLAVLLARPGDEVHCLELMGAANVQGSAGPGLDDTARRQYQARVLELQHEVEEAQSDNDPVRAEKAELELDLLVQQLSEAFGLSGRARSSGSSAEKARTAVTYRIRAAIKRVSEVQPDLGRHLSNSVRTGAWCAYRPESDPSWEVEPA